MDPTGKGWTHIGEGGLGPGAAEGGERGTKWVTNAEDLLHIGRRDAGDCFPRCQDVRARSGDVGHRLEGC